MFKYVLAQLNIALMKEPIDSPLMADFVANLDRMVIDYERGPGGTEGIRVCREQ